MMAAGYAVFGSELLPLMPNGTAYLRYAAYMPWLVVINVLTTCQVFYANAEVSAGRFDFLWWFVPLHLTYVGAVHICIILCNGTSMPVLVFCFGAISVLRFAFSAFSMKFTRCKRR